MLNEKDFQHIETAVRTAAVEYMNGEGIGAAMRVLKQSRATALSLAAQRPVQRGTVLAAADALGLLSLSIPCALAVSSLPNAGEIG